MATRHADPATSQRARRAAKWAVVVGVTGFALKMSGWLLTGSDAVFSDALESIVNIVASLGAFLALKYAERPPDEEHPYGHGPIEFVSALFEGVLVAVAGLVILTHCAESIYRGRAPIERIDVGLALVAASGLLNGIAGFALLRIGRKTGSAALEGDGKHLLSDLVTTVAVPSPVASSTSRSMRDAMSCDSTIDSVAGTRKCMSMKCDRPWWRWRTDANEQIRGSAASLWRSRTATILR